MNGNKISVSIIIPVKNEAHRLPACLKSIKQIDYDQEFIEIIVIDNGSSDSTVDIAIENGCKVYKDHSSNISGLRNLGVKHACGDVICFVDADVLVSKKWLTNALQNFNINKVACVTGMINIPENATWVEKTWALNRKVSKDKFLVSWSTSMNMIIIKDIFDNINGFNDALVTGEDFDLSTRIRKAGYDIIFDKEVSVIHTGEAKTLIDFVRKERWHGYSDLDLLISNKFKLSNLRHATQPIFFIGTFLLFIYSVLTKKCHHQLVSISLLFLLPVLRTFLIIKKQSNYYNIIKLLIIWTVYYYARSLAIIDNLIDKIMIKWSFNKLHTG
jgi:glycosyltransferase involved in cell wall biosynthesis